MIITKTFDVRHKLRQQKPSRAQVTSFQKNQADMAVAHTFHKSFYMSAMPESAIQMSPPLSGQCQNVSAERELRRKV